MAKKGHVPAVQGKIVKPALLSLLRERRAHGYLLVSGLSAFGVEVKDPSRIYRILHSMEEASLLRSEWDLSEGPGPPRRVYAITPKGRRELRAWEAQLKQERDLLGRVLRARKAEQEQRATRARDQGDNSP